MARPVMAVSVAGAMIAVGVAIVVFSHQRLAGPRLGSAAIRGSDIQYCYVLQSGPISETSRGTDPLFLIVWKSLYPGAEAANFENKLVSIHGRRMNVSFTDPAVYALKRNYTLERIELTETEVRHILTLVAQNRLPYAEDALWRERIDPMLDVLAISE